MNGNEKTKKPRYFPNKWKKYKDIDPSAFTPLGYEDFMLWKCAGWILPSNVDCVIRATNIKTKKVKEHVYKLGWRADQRIGAYRKAGTHEFVICCHDEIIYYHPDLEHGHPFFDDDDVTQF